MHAIIYSINIQGPKVLLTIFLSFLMGCGSKDNQITSVKLPIIEIPVKLDEIIEIKEWLAIGPFTFNSKKQLPSSSFNNKDLAIYNINEDHFTKNDILIIINNNVKHFYISENSAYIKLFRYVDNKFENKSNIYLCTEIFSPHEKVISLIVDGSNSYKLWLNENLLLDVINKHNTNKSGDRFVNVTLKKGNNLLFAKVNRGNNKKSWEFVVGVSSVTEAQKVFRTNYYSDFIIDPIVDDSIQFYYGPYQRAKIQITNSQDIEISLDSLSRTHLRDNITTLHGLKELDNGFYKCRLTFSKEYIEEYFYKGDYLDLINEISNSIESTNLDELDMNDIISGYQRIAFLSDEEVNDSSSSEIKSLNRNRVFWTKALKDLLIAGQYQRSLKDIPGTSIRTYTSPNKDSIYHFVLHVGKGALQKTKIPLILVIPYELSGESMIDDWYISNLDQIEIDNRMADDFGFAIVWLYMRGRKYTLQASLEEVNYVLRRIKEEFKIDTNQLYVLGDCEGGRKALLLVQSNPDCFAGIAVTSPITFLGQGTEVPINYIQNLYNIPLAIKHGLNDEISSVENSRRLISTAHKYGFSPKYIETDDCHLTFAKDYRKYAFEFFDSINNKQKKSPPTTIKYSLLNTSDSIIYWIKISKKDNPLLVELSAEYRPNDKVINLTCQNLNSYCVLFDKLNLTKGTSIKVYTNNNLSFNGIVEGKELHIDLVNKKVYAK